MFWLNAEAPENIPVMVITEAVFHLEISRLNVIASANTASERNADGELTRVLKAGLEADGSGLG